MFSIGRRHTDNPSLHEFLGVAWIRPLAELLGGHQGFGGRHQIISLWSQQVMVRLSPISRLRSIPAEPAAGMDCSGPSQAGNQPASPDDLFMAIRETAQLSSGPV